MKAGPDFAVLIPILDHRGEECVLLTLRNANLPHYAGQVSFPGGAQEPGETLKDTALRETNEEVGIPSKSVEVFAELGWFQTRLGHRVRPFAGRIQGPYKILPHSAEVARVIYVPVSFLQKDPFQSRGSFNDESGITHTIYTFMFDKAEIWGLTARVLKHFFVERKWDSEGERTIIT